MDDAPPTEAVICPQVDVGMKGKRRISRPGCGGRHARNKRWPIATVFIHLALTRHGTPKVPGIDWILWPEANLSGALIHAKRVLERAIHWLLVKLFLSCWEHLQRLAPGLVSFTTS